MSDIATGEAQLGDTDNTLLLKIATSVQNQTGGGAPTGAAGGDLSGTYPDPSVAKVAGVTPSAAFLTIVDDADLDSIINTLFGATFTGLGGAVRRSNPVFLGTATAPNFNAASGYVAAGTSLSFAQAVYSTTAFATPAAFSATAFYGFASTADGAVIMGYGTTNDVTLMNRAGSVALRIPANSTTVTMSDLSVSNSATVTNDMYAGRHGYSGRGMVAFTADGVILMTGWGGDFGTLRFSSADSSHSEFGFSGTTITARRADGSAGGAFVASGTLTVGGALIGTPQALSGAGAVNVTTLTTAFTSTGVADALTLANGTDGQIKIIDHVADGGSGVLTPTTANGFSIITFTNVGESATLCYHTTGGWVITAIRGAIAA